MESGPLPLLGQAWLLSGFDFDFDPYAIEPVLFAAPGETPLLTVPPTCRNRELELAFGWAIAQLFLLRYGPIALVQGIKAWDNIVSDLGSGKDVAAD